VSAIAKKYASAIVELAHETNLVEIFHEQIQQLHTIIQSSALDEFLGAPQISQSEKKALIEKTLSTFHPYIIRFLFVTIDKKRTSQLLTICEEVTLQLDRSLNIKRGIVKSTRAMSEEQLKTLSQALSTSWKAKVILSNVIDTALIGGYKIEMEDAILDGSLRGQLDELRSYLNSERRMTHGA
jgi:F-type H+-transporting ATPase subunit delta